MDTQTQPPNTPPQTPPHNSGIAILAYLGILVIIPLLAAKDDPFVKYHVKQGLVLLIGWVAASVVSIIPFFGWMISPFLWLAVVVFMVLGILNAANGKEQPLPFIGHLADNFHF